MVVVNMSPIPPKVIGRKACLKLEVLLGLLKHPRPKEVPKHLKEGGVKRSEGL